MLQNIVMNAINAINNIMKNLDFQNVSLVEKNFFSITWHVNMTWRKI